MPATLAPGPCGNCLQRSPSQNTTQSLFRYKGAVREAILAWKLGGDDSGVSMLIHSAEARLRTMFNPDDLLIPVPMPLERMRKSGLHHSADLCKKIISITGSRMDWQILRRTGNQVRQSTLKGKARKKNLQQAFTLAANHQTAMESYDNCGRIWVVDDILTTGATLHHACKIMKRTKSEVHAFSLARTLFE